MLTTPLTATYISKISTPCEVILSKPNKFFMYKKIAETKKVKCLHEVMKRTGGNN